MIGKFLTSRLDVMQRQQLDDGSGRPVDLSEPTGEPALVPGDSVSWEVFGNPVTLLIGGITAVLLELAEPKVRSGVWDHTSFRTDPLKRMRRTGIAAMITVYGARSQAVRMIEGVRRMHERVQGNTPEGTPYQANDPDLLRWVHATAAFGFLQAYQQYVKPLSCTDRDRFYAEGAPIARLYGAERAPISEAELDGLFTDMLPRLEPSVIISEFLRIMDSLPLLPRPLRPLNKVIIRASIDLLPPAIQQRLGLGREALSSPMARMILRAMARGAGRLHLPSAPAAQARSRVKQRPL